MADLDEKYVTYLQEIDTWGVTDVTTVYRLLQEQFPDLSIDQARAVVTQWNETKNQLLLEDKPQT